MTETLELRFRNDESRLVTIRVPDPRDDLDAPAISAVMDAILANNIFTGSALNLVEKDSARIVTREEEYFDLTVS